MPKPFKLTTAISIIVANMVGTGVFTSLGFQLLEFDHPKIILMLWLLGGLTALCGGLCYAKLSKLYPHSGGEYQFVSRAIHPRFGFIAGFISATVGFAAPTALVAITATTYLNAALPELPINASAILLIVILSLLHMKSTQSSAGTQNLLTFVKIGLVMLFIGSAFLFSTPTHTIGFERTIDWQLISPAAVAVALIYVNYAYTGWNAVTYVLDEMEDSAKTVRKALLIATTIVITLYIGLNMAFMYASPVALLAGKIDVGVVVANTIWGSTGAQLTGVFFALLLVSTASAMTLAGPRSIAAMGRDYSVLSWLATLNRAGIPAVAIAFQTALTLLFILSASFSWILVFSGVALAISSLVTVCSLPYSYYRKDSKLGNFPRLYWIPVCIYSSLTIATLIYLASSRPSEIIAASGLCVTGFALYLVSERFSDSPAKSEIQ